jgi:hypothetical protein
MIDPVPSVCGAGAGGGELEDILSATLLDVGFEVLSVLKSTIFGLLLREALLCVEISVGEVVNGRMGSDVLFVDSGEVPCVFDRAQERIRSREEGESDEVFVIDN